MDVVILLGAPGSGKGTVAEKIRESTVYVHVSTGDMLREAVKADTEVGREAQSYMERGTLVPDDVMIRIVEERLDRDKADARYLFDGFPRTPAQAELLEQCLAKRGGSISVVFLLETPREVLISRLAGRRVCRDCGATFHAVNIPPRVSGVCDACGGELYQRKDDNEETVTRRLEVYRKETESLIERYERDGLLRRVNSDQGVELLVSEIGGIIGGAKKDPAA